MKLENVVFVGVLSVICLFIMMIVGSLVALEIHEENLNVSCVTIHPNAILKDARVEMKIEE